ncbi:MAG: hypothetical protein AB1468_03690 [Candidatus Micrarchaeota archaeon]
MEKHVDKRSVAQRVFDALDSDPYARQSIKLGIANITAVAERIRGEHAPHASIEAVRTAIRRYIEGIDYYEYEHVRDLKKLFRKAKLTLKNDIAVLRLHPSALLNLERISKVLGKDFSMISSQNAVTLIIDQARVEEAVEAIGKPHISHIGKNFHAIMITSPQEVEEVPGWVAFIAELLARNEINIREYYSCYMDTVFVLGKEDALRAYALMEKALKG